MIFYSEKKKEIVWDAEKEKALCQFEEGIFKTEDEKIIKKLKKLGYKYKTTKK